MRRFIAATLMLVVAVPAIAQAPVGVSAPGGAAGGGGRGGRSTPPQTVDQEKKKADEKAFTEAVKRIPQPDKKFDPWGNVRGASKN